MGAIRKLEVNGWDVVLSHEEPRVLDLDVARTAGVKVPASIRNVIDRNRDELEAHGTLEVFDYQSKTPAGGRPGRQYLLNEAQALALVALMRTPKARELRVALVRLFVAVRHGLVAAPPAGAPPAVPFAEVHGSRVGDTHARRELVSWCVLAATAHGVTIHRIHGALRRQYKVPSAYALSVSVWPTARAFLEDLATKRLYLDAPTRQRPVLQLVQGGASRQLGLPGVG